MPGRRWWRFFAPFESPSEQAERGGTVRWNAVLFVMMNVAGWISDNVGRGLHAYRQGRYRCNVRGSPDIPGAGRPRLLLAGGLVPSRDVRQEQGRTVERLHERLGAGGRHSGAAHHQRGSGQRQLGSGLPVGRRVLPDGSLLVAGTTRWSTDQAYHAKYPADGQAAITA